MKTRFCHVSATRQATIVLAATMLPMPVFAQTSSQPTDLASPSTIDAATGGALNAAIEALRAARYDDALTALGSLDLASMSAYERSRTEQVLFNVYFSKKDFATARLHLERAIHAGGLTPEERAQAEYQRAQVLMSDRRWQEGADALEAWLESTPSRNAASYYLLAVAYYQLGDFERALSPAQRAVDLADPPNETWLALLLAVRLQRAEYEDAIRLLNRLVVLYPGKKTYLMQLSAAYGQTRDYRSALAIAQLAYDAGLLTEDEELRRFADLLLLNDLPRRAARVLETALESGAISADASLHEKIANAWTAAGQPKLAPPARP